MRGCAPRALGRGDPCTQRKKRKMRDFVPVRSFFWRNVEVYSATGTSSLRVLAPKLPNRASARIFFRILGAGVTPAEGAGRAAPRLIDLPQIREHFPRADVTDFALQNFA